jgi:very-short-patch-repair endonuclease
VDFYCPERSLVIEVDGDIHGDQHQIVKDRRRESYLRALGLEVIRYMNDDVLKNLDGVLEDLYERVLSRSTSPPPPYKGGGERQDGH